MAMSRAFLIWSFILGFQFGRCDRVIMDSGREVRNYQYAVQNISVCPGCEVRSLRGDELAATVDAEDLAADEVGEW